ncbi:TonB family protein [Nostoc sp. PCC 7524]|uniref:energy transducer TonB n=1 Tax=Nostoc sp. (strain ATCC 29411 / PCC 7524) TaxID=28072 RepID=UPI00029EFBBF|nr:energy transducer TonB [Nostoc sp. PCC 7524]AFY48750.1 TonB family protein [Nostoc sp. PCC 7524]
MTFSGIAVEQRSKETEALRSFLVYSLIGSVALHIGILTIGIGNLLRKTAEVEAEPLEVTIVESPTVETEPTPKEIKPEPKPQPETPIRRVTPEVSSPSEIALAPQPQPQAAPVAITPLKLKTEPVSNLKTPPVPSKAPEKPQSTAQPQRVLTSEPSNTQQTTTQPVAPSSDKLRSLLSGIRDTRATQGNSSNSDTVAESNNSASIGSNVAVNTGNTADTGLNVTNRRRRSSDTVATAPSSVKIESPSGNNSGNDSSRAGNGRAACRECSTRYPESARRRGIEGKVEVAVDTDEKGNVTNVRIVNSSGNRDLDEETIRQARNWKLKPAANGRQGVSIATEYAITGSRRYRELQERKRQRQAQARQRTTAASANTTEEAVSNQQSSRTSNNTENRIRRRRLSPTSSPDTRPSTASTTNTRTSENQRSIRNSLRRARRELPVTQASPTSQPQPTANRRRRRNQTQEASSSSASRLRNALRRSRQPSQSQPSSSTTSTETSTPTENKNE